MSNINLLFFNILSKFIWTLIDWYTPVRPYERLDCCDRCISRWNNTSTRSFFINNTFSSTSKLLTPNMHHYYTGRISEWMIFEQRLFAQRKWITERCSLRDAFSGSVAIFIVDKMTLQWCHRNKTHSCYSELNYIQNLYFGFFIFWELTELYRFVTYLSDDPRTFGLVSVCLFVSQTITFESLDVWSSYVHIRCISRVKFIYEGHRVKFEVTEAKRSKMPVPAM